MIPIVIENKNISNGKSTFYESLDVNDAQAKFDAFMADYNKNDEKYQVDSPIGQNDKNRVLKAAKMADRLWHKILVYYEDEGYDLSDYEVMKNIYEDVLERCFTNIDISSDNTKMLNEIDNYSVFSDNHPFEDYVEDILSYQDESDNPICIECLESYSISIK